MHRSFPTHFAVLAATLLWSAPAAAETYQLRTLDLRFYVDHPFKRVEGICSRITSQIALKGPAGSVEMAGPARFTVPFDGISTGSSGRDSHALEVLGYPRFKAAEGRIDTIKPDRPGSYVLTGVLTVFGTERPLALKASVTPEGSSFKVSGSFIMKFSEFGMMPPALLSISAKDDVSVVFNAIFDVTP